ncbi:MAG: segregation and condensation protein A [Planctomycetota bacterium]|jgi:hypothetical protein
MTLQDEYQVKLDTFCGPLDLLLYLIRRAEVDIHDIPIAKITDQYLQVLRQVEHVDIEAAGEFLVMAATLMEAKSRTLMPPEAQIDEDGVESVALQEIEVTPGAPADSCWSISAIAWRPKTFSFSGRRLPCSSRASRIKPRTTSRRSPTRPSWSWTTLTCTTCTRRTSGSSPPST